MNQKQHREYIQAVKDAVQEQVNGKIEIIHTELVVHAALDKAFQDKAEHILEGLENLTGAGKLLITTSGGLAVVIGLAIALKSLFWK